MTAKISKKGPGLEPSLKSLTISPTKAAGKSKHTPDSWEEEATANSPHHSASDSAMPNSPLTPTAQESVPGPPPPTPISPTHRRGKSTDWASFPENAAPRSSPRGSFGAEKQTRPEKSAATAGRMIAGALGVKGPKLNEEQKQYERAVREKEKKKIEGEREERRRKEREKEEAKKAVWDD